MSVLIEINTVALEATRILAWSQTPDPPGSSELDVPEVAHQIVGSHGYLSIIHDS
jgi:hypothetical protein